MTAVTGRAGDPGVRRAHLVVREHQVAAARLHVEGRAEVLGGDRRALHVPAGPPGPEARLPGRLARPLRPPDERVERVLLAWPVRVAAALGGQLGHLRDGQPGRGARPGQRAELLVR